MRGWFLVSSTESYVYAVEAVVVIEGVVFGCPFAGRYFPVAQSSDFRGFRPKKATRQVHVMDTGDTDTT